MFEQYNKYTEENHKKRKSKTTIWKSEENSSLGGKYIVSKKNKPYDAPPRMNKTPNKAITAHSKISLPANSLKNDFVDFHGFLI